MSNEDKARNPLLCAYDIEGQAIAVSELVVKGLLAPWSSRVQEVRYVEEAGGGWYRIFCADYIDRELYEGDCTEHIRELKKGNLIRGISGISINRLVIKPR